MTISHHDAAESLDLWLGKPAPRYTSYPPAPFFHAGINGEAYGRSLSRLPPDAPVSLYIHIPFCKSLCLYCGCNTAITQRPQRIADYLQALKREMALITGIAGRRRVSHLHFGGGTPNMLPDEDILGLFEALRHNFDFSDAHEIAMELDPRSVTPKQVETLAACGITRVSLGVQDFDAAVQALVHRHQPLAMVEDVCGWLRAAGIGRINFDLMYGLPKQTLASVADTARRVCGLRPDRVALFSYAHVPQLKKHQMALEEHGLPDLRERLALDQTARDVLLGQGYHAIGIDHFARADDTLTQAWRAGTLHRNFQGYTEDDATTLVSLGASAISQTEDGYFQNDRDEYAYQALVAEGALPVRRGYLLTPDDRVRRAVIERLMCALSCDIAAVCRAYDYPVTNFDDAIAQLAPFESAAIVVRDGYKVTLATPHRMAVRVISALFDDHTPRRAETVSSRTA